MQAKKVLVIGGNRFFGKNLVEKLIAADHEVYLLNRGKEKDCFKGRVQRLVCDRKDSRFLTKTLKPHSFDIVVSRRAESLPPNPR